MWNTLRPRLLILLAILGVLLGAYALWPGAPVDEVRADFCPCIFCGEHISTATGAGTASTCFDARVAAELDARAKVPGSCTVCWQSYDGDDCVDQGNGTFYSETIMSYRCCTEFGTC